MYVADAYHNIVIIIEVVILSLFSLLQNMGVNGCGERMLPGDSYPDWLTFNFKGSSVIFEVP